MKISVIIPVYNTEKYLRECLDSVLAQTFTDFEVLVINDGSTDSSGKICDEYAQKDARVKVFHKENGGVSSARNLGLDNAKGEWITFVDSDDSIKENYLTDFVNDTKYNGNIDFYMYGKYGSRELLQDTPIVEYINLYDSFHLFEIFKLTPNGQTCSKFFKTSLINKYCLRFDNRITLSEDILFILEYLINVNEMKYRDIYYYYYRDTPDSLSNTDKVDFDSNYRGFEKINLILKEYNSLELNEYKNLKTTYFNFYLRALQALHVNGYTRVERIRYYKELYECMLFPNLKLNRSANILHKIAFMFFKQQQFVAADIFLKQIYALKLLIKKK